MTDHPSPPISRLIAATLTALLVALVLLFVAVLPVEYGVDPLGTGRALGLLRSELDAPGTTPAVVTPTPPSTVASGPLSIGPIQYFSRPYATNSATFTLGPYEYVEYKYRLEAGAAMTFAWAASTTVLHDLHAEPDGGAEHAEVSFDQRDLDRASGLHTAPFAGLHGWMWENPGPSTVSVTITTAGFYGSATEFRPNRRRIDHPITVVLP